MVRQHFLRMIEYISYFFFSKFPAVLVAMLCSTIPISILGTKFAMAATPFWDPIQFGTVYSLAKKFSSSRANTSLYSFSPYSWHALWYNHVRTSDRY